MAQKIFGFDTFLRDLIGDHKTISFIGLERACGKTTAFKVFFEALFDKPIGITSIGTDHLSSKNTLEESNLVYIREGTFVATSRSSLSLCDTTKEILQTTGIQTPLGEIILFRAQSAGVVFLAGPSVIADSIRIRDSLFKAGARVVLMDGAVDRRSSATPQLADGIVITGRLFEHAVDKFSNDVETFLTPSLEDAALSDLCQQYTDSKVPYFAIDETHAVHFPKDEEIKDGLASWIINFEKPIRVIFLSGAVTNLSIQPLLKADSKVIKKLTHTSLVAGDPTKLFIDPNNKQILDKKGLALRVLHPVKILALCVNPCQSGLEMNRVDQLMKNFASRFKLPVLDAVRGVFVEGF